MYRRSLLAGAAALAASPAFALAQSGGRTRVVFWHAMNGVLGEEVNRLCTGFNGSQSTTEIVPVFKGTYPETLTAAIAAWRAGQAPQPGADVRGRHRLDAGRRARRSSRSGSWSRRPASRSTPTPTFPRSRAITACPMAASPPRRSTPAPPCSGSTRTRCRRPASTRTRPRPPGPSWSRCARP